MRADFLIVGQGLAGSALALELTKRGKKIVIISDPESPGASRVAAGLYNPVTGNRLVKTWKADVLFKGLEDFYKSQESLLSGNFLNQIGIYRPFSSLNEQNDWMANSGDPNFSAYIADVRGTPHASGLLKDSYGGIYLKRAGFLETSKFLDAVKKYFTGRGCFIEELFYEQRLLIKEKCVQYGSVEADKIVFCHGLGAVGGKFFSWLPFQPLKGEILEAKSEVGLDTVFNRGCFILPMNNKTLKIGSTYNWKQPDSQATLEGKNELLEKLNNIFKPDVEVVGHQAGVRPSTKDRRPMLGRHPEHASVYTFNGLGTKGVSLAPYFAAELADHLIFQKPLMPEVDIQRFFSLYFESKTER